MEREGRAKPVPVRIERRERAVAQARHAPAATATPSPPPFGGRARSLSSCSASVTGPLPAGRRASVKPCSIPNGPAAYHSVSPARSSETRFAFAASVAPRPLETGAAAETGKAHRERRPAGTQRNPLASRCAATPPPASR